MRKKKSAPKKSAMPGVNDVICAIRKGTGAWGKLPREERAQLLTLADLCEELRACLEHSHRQVCRLEIDNGYLAADVLRMMTDRRAGAAKPTQRRGD